MIIRCKSCSKPFDISEKHFDYAVDFARKFNTLAKFYCERCSNARKKGTKPNVKPDDKKKA